MPVLVYVPRGKQLHASTLLKWDPLNDTATIGEGDTREQVKLSCCLPFSKVACQQIEANPKMLTLNQAS
ncbi:hypothetical protein ACFSR9_15175 [Deinococcus taklimakanensis]|uniref:Uncharacterized protein n=1 Tax=Deinococcus taklimakanensis TaxID=536443 RepID=A0ABW5P929_9DEIO